MQREMSHKTTRLSDLPAKQTVMNWVQRTIRQIYEAFRLWTL